MNTSKTIKNLNIFSFFFFIYCTWFKIQGLKYNIYFSCEIPPLPPKVKLELAATLPILLTLSLLLTILFLLSLRSKFPLPPTPPPVVLEEKLEDALEVMLGVDGLFSLKGPSRGLGGSAPMAC